MVHTFKICDGEEEVKKSEIFHYIRTLMTVIRQINRDKKTIFSNDEDR